MIADPFQSLAVYDDLRLEEAQLEASGVVDKVHQIGDRFSIYRVR